MSEFRESALLLSFFFARMLKFILGILISTAFCTLAYAQTNQLDGKAWTADFSGLADPATTNHSAFCEFVFDMTESYSAAINVRTLYCTDYVYEQYFRQGLLNGEIISHPGGLAHSQLSQSDNTITLSFHLMGDRINIPVKLTFEEYVNATKSNQKHNNLRKQRRFLKSRCRESDMNHCDSVIYPLNDGMPFMDSHSRSAYFHHKVCDKPEVYEQSQNHCDTEHLYTVSKLLEHYWVNVDPKILSKEVAKRELQLLCLTYSRVEGCQGWNKKKQSGEGLYNAVSHEAIAIYKSGCQLGDLEHCKLLETIEENPPIETLSEQKSELEVFLFGETQSYSCGNTPQEAFTLADKLERTAWKNKVKTSIYAVDPLDTHNSTICYARSCEGGVAKSCEAIWGSMESLPTPAHHRPQLLDLLLKYAASNCDAGDGAICSSLGEFYLEDGIQMEGSLESWCEETFDDNLCPVEMEKYLYPEVELGLEFYKKGCLFNYAESCNSYAQEVFYGSEYINKTDYDAVVFAQKACELAEQQKDDEKRIYCEFAEEYSEAIIQNDREIEAAKLADERERIRQRAKARERKKNMNLFFSTLLGGVTQAIEQDRKIKEDVNRQIANTQSSFRVSQAQQDEWDRNAEEAKLKTDAWMWQLEEDARIKAEATAKERRDQQKIKRANSRGATSQRSLTLRTSGSTTSESGSNRLTSGTTRVYQLGACGNEPTVWASSVKPAVRGKNVGVFKVYHVVQPYDQWGRYDFGLGKVNESQCYYEYEIENEDMPSEYYPDGPYYEIGSKLFFFISKQHVRDHRPAKVNEKGTSYYFDDKLAACQKANIDIDYNFPAQVRDKPNFMKKGWGFELKFVENHAKHCGDI